MGGKTSTSTSQTQIPQSVLNQYSAVNQNAAQVAQTPFQQYSTDPNAFVAPLNSTEQAGIAGTTAAANQAQPYYTAATGVLGDAQNAASGYYGAATGSAAGAAGAAAPLQSQAATGLGTALAGAQGTDATAEGQTQASSSPLTGAQINSYLSPYLGDVLGSESALLNQNNQQSMSGELGNIISSGAFGGDRAGIAAANLNQQNTLANSSIYSGILNTGYNNALSAAQQQQQTGLAGASQLANIGNQAYTQGTNTAEDQAALGAQEYGQGITSANTLAGLGQDVYNTGAATSSGLASLGSGAQSAADSGAQAELAAGQVAQQTQQAGDTALYNQFEQQQSYPFQVAQFLANIAEGTGSLSGSTTTTTTPGSLLSDKRAKEKARVVGFTFDGQPIYTYRYKGQDTTHMGLMAQDVEKKHPEAVGKAGSFKTVNYDKATDDAAERGHFAAGGSPGFDPQLAQEMMQNGQAMYAQSPGGSAGSSPYGGSARVPAANLPVSGLKTPQVMGQQQGQMSGLAAANQDAKQWSDLASNLSKGADVVQKMGFDASAANDTTGNAVGQVATDAAPVAANDASDLSQAIPDFGLKRGGLARARYAGGGMPYQDGDDLDIPNDQPSAQLQTAKTAGGQGGQGGGLIGALGTGAGLVNAGATLAPAVGAAASGIGSAISSILPLLALKRGGRAGFADGGSPDDSDSDWGAIPGLLNTVAGYAGDIGKSGLNAITHLGQTSHDAGLAGAGLPITDDGGSDAKSGPTLQDVAKASSADQYRKMVMGNAAQTATTPEEYGAILKATPTSGGPSGGSGGSHHSGHSGLAAPDPWPNGPPDDALNVASDASHDQTNYQAPQVQTANMMPMAGETLDAPSAGLATPTPSSGLAAANPSDIVSGAKNAVGDIINKVAPKGSYLDNLFHGDKASVISLLSGLGAMTAAPTRNFGTALAQGLSAGANSYQGVQSQQAELANKAAHTAQVQEATQAQVQQQYGNANTTMVPGAASDPTKTIMVAGQPYHAVPRGTLLDTGASTDATKAPGYQSFMRYQGLDSGTQSAETQKNLDTIKNGAAVSQDRLGTNSYATAFVTGDKSLLAPGAIAPAIQKPLAMYNAIASKVGLPQIDPAGQTNAQIVDKMSNQSALLGAHGADQNSLGALQVALHQTPNPGMDRGAGIKMLADRYVSNQVQADKADMAQQFDPNKDGPLAGQYRSEDLDSAFAAAHPTEDYERDRGALRSAMASPTWPAMMKAVETGDPKAQAAAKNWLDRFAPNLHRYVVGNQ